MFQNAWSSAMALLLCCWGLAPFSGAAAQAAWYGDWAYRTPVAVANPCGEEVEEYAVRLELDSSFDFSKVEADGSDFAPHLRRRGNPHPLLDRGLGPRRGVGPHLDPASRPAARGHDDLPLLRQAGRLAVLQCPGDLRGLRRFRELRRGSIPTGGAVNPGEWGRSPANPLLTEGRRTVGRPRRHLRQRHLGRRGRRVSHVLPRLLRLGAPDRTGHQHQPRGPGRSMPATRSSPPVPRPGTPVGARPHGLGRRGRATTG